MLTQVFRHAARTGLRGIVAPRLAYGRGAGRRPFHAPGEAWGGQQLHPLLGHQL